MKTYTIEQFKKYLSKQDSMGDIHYNLSKIDDFLIDDEVRVFKFTDELIDFLHNAEENGGAQFEWEGTTFRFTETVSDSIREYGYEAFSDIPVNIESYLEQGFIEEI